MPVALLSYSLCVLQCSLMDENGNTKDDLGLPKGTDDAEKLAIQLKSDFEEGKELVVTVLKVRLRDRQPLLSLGFWYWFVGMTLG
jgi:Eukaryotic elongation factor 5A hypusine, DNA-binding OB fold